jgi:tetratricopeptide (TPR) repeat protein
MKRTLLLALLCLPLSAQQPDDKGANADLVAARAANKEQCYTDAETLMLKTTTANPRSSLMWFELGTAEMGLKKYPESELAFQKALGIDSTTQNSMHSEDFFSPENPGSTHTSRNTAGHTVLSNEKLNPEIVGAAYSNLGEVYARTQRIPQAQAAYDAAAKANPTKASLYLGNETIIFFQLGDAASQVAAADKAIAVDPNRALLYFFKGQGLASKATVDPQSQKLVMPPGCIDAYRKYLALEPNGKYAEDAKQMIAAAGLK